MPFAEGHLSWRGAARRLAACVRLHGLAFGRSLAPALLGVGLVMAVVLGGHGVPPRELARLLRESSLGRVVVPFVWALLTRAGVHTVVLPPGAAWLRSGPMSRAVQVLVAASFVVAAQSPIVGVLLAGHDPLAAVTLGAVAATLACAPVDPRGALFVVLSLSLLAPQVLAWSLVATRALVVLAVFAAAIHHAWREAPIRRRVHTLRLRALPAAVQLILAHARSVVRERPFAAARATILPVLAYVLVAHTRRRNAIDPWDRTSLLQLGAILTVVTSAPLLSPVGRMRRMLRRVVRASATPRVVALLAAIVVVTSPALAFAAGLGAASMRAGGASTSVLDAWWVAAFCWTIGVLLVRLEERVHARRRDAPFVLVLLALAVGACFAIAARLPGPILVGVLGSSTTWGLFAREREVPLADDA